MADPLTEENQMSESRHNDSLHQIIYFRLSYYNQIIYFRLFLLVDRSTPIVLTMSI